MGGTPLDALHRWKVAGGTWRVVSRDAEGVTIALLTCTGDEEMGGLRIPAPGWAPDRRAPVVTTALDES